MRSLYGRLLAITVSIVLISFILFGAVFAGLSFRYTLKEKQDSLKRNAGFIAEFTAAALAQGLTVEDSFFQAYVSSISRISDATVLLAETDGEVVYSSNSALVGGGVSRLAMEQALLSGQYSAMSNLGGVLPQLEYVVGMPISVTVLGQKTTAGAVFVAAETGAILVIWRSLVVIFLFTAAAISLISFVLCLVISRYQSRPLKEMAEATRKFAHGEFDARVDPGNRRDEVGELAVSFNAMAESLAKSEARRSEFVANVSHELKTPMTTIAGFADGILDGAIPAERQEEALRTISAETRRLSRLVRRMLDLSRLQSTQEIAVQEPFDVCETMARVLVSLETKINDKGLDVRADFPEGPLKVWGDPDAITQVGYNLLDNAIKFADPGGLLRLSISSKGNKALVSVADQGMTIPPEELPLIFDRFHKTDHSRSVDRDGVGLGLYIVKTILNTHKEDVAVTSQDGLTEFTFTLTRA